MNDSTPKHDPTLERQPTAPAMGLIAFDHVTLIVASVEASRKFYVELLGMSEAIRPAFDFPGAWFQIGNTMIHITLSDENSGLAGWGNREVVRPSRGHHLAYSTADFDEALRLIQLKHVPVAAGPQTRPDGARQIYITDPDGHLIEICEGLEICEGHA